jgi:hypothetical protein
MERTADERAAKDGAMTDRMPNDLGELDTAIGNAMMDAADRATVDAELYAAEREQYTAEHGDPDPATFPKWSEISEPGELDYGPFTPHDEP